MQSSAKNQLNESTTGSFYGDDNMTDPIRISTDPHHGRPTGSGSAWRRQIRIRMEEADPDPEGKKSRNKTGF